MKRLIPLCALFLAGPALAASPIEGRWTNPSRSVTVRIAPCGGSALCGQVVSATPEAKAKAAAAGTARLVGTRLMSGLVATGTGVWQGEFFVPDLQRSAGGELRLLGPRTIEVEGCAVPGLLCRSQQWTRVAASAKARRRR
jgi:uncharacterized protein (DUF2147 family)